MIIDLVCENCGYSGDFLISVDVDKSTIECPNCHKVGFMKTDFRMKPGDMRISASERRKGFMYIQENSDSPHSSYYSISERRKKR
jgi:uncharacterized Zn finger protein